MLRKTKGNRIVTVIALLLCLQCRDVSDRIEFDHKNCILSLDDKYTITRAFLYRNNILFLEFVQEPTGEDSFPICNLDFIDDNENLIKIDLTNTYTVKFVLKNKTQKSYQYSLDDKRNDLEYLDEIKQ